MPWRNLIVPVIAPHAPHAMLYPVPMLIGCRLMLPIRCTTRFMSAGRGLFDALFDDLLGSRGMDKVFLTWT